MPTAAPHQYHTGTTLVPHLHQLTLPACAPDPKGPLLLKAWHVAWHRGALLWCGALGQLAHMGAGSPGASTADAAWGHCGAGHQMPVSGCPAGAAPRHWIAGVYFYPALLPTGTCHICGVDQKTSQALVSAAPCDLSTKNFSLVAYQKEQENLSALLFLIEHTHTYICVCMAFSKNKALCLCSHGKI